MADEIEVKIPMPDAVAAGRLLAEKGYTIYKERGFEQNAVYDNPALNLREKKLLLRLRQSNSQSILTYKGAPVAGPHKRREEIETAVVDGEAFGLILERLGFQRTFRYEKYRTSYNRAEEAGQITLDETPMGVYLELEGGGDWIDSTAQELGFQKDSYVLDSYGSLYRNYRRQHPTAAADMIFPHGIEVSGQTP